MTEGDIVFTDGLPVELTGCWIEDKEGGQVWSVKYDTPLWLYFVKPDMEPERIYSLGQFCVDRYGELPTFDLGPGVQELLDLLDRER